MDKEIAELQKRFEAKTQEVQQKAHQQENKASVLVNKELNNQYPQNTNGLNTLLENKVKQTEDVKTAIDLLATREALADENTVNKIVDEKTEELRNDAEAKRVSAETNRINEEVAKIKRQKEKELEEYDRLITARKKEAEQLKADADKAQAFFEANGEILKYIGVRSKKSLKTMQALMVPATIIFAIVQILLFPLTLCGVVLEALVNIVGGICNAIKNQALKIVASIGVILLISSAVFGVYFFGGNLIGL